MTLLVAGCANDDASRDAEPSPATSTTVTARTEAFMRCLDDSGWEARVDADGGVIIEGMSDKRYEEFLKVESRCSDTVERIPP